MTFYKAFMNHLKKAYKYSFLFILFIISFYSVFSQTHSSAAPKLNTTGLANEQFIRSVFTGDFAAIDFDRDNPSFSLILSAYIDAYWNKCGTSLPSNKMEVTYPECIRWTEYKNGFGTVVKKDCLEWQTHHTNVYASPAMYEAKTTVDDLQSNDDVKNIFRILKQDNPIGALSNYNQQAVVLKNDMNSFFSMNDCNSAGIKQFEQNLYAFAMNKLPIILEGSNIPRLDPNVLIKDQKFNNLIDDLLKKQSETWVINQYVPNSITKEKIVSKDNKGRPADVSADYRFMAGRNELDGSVKLTFKEGLPNCLYFYDDPTTCRTASRKIVLDYATGKYIDKDTLYKTSGIFFTVDKKDSNWIVKFTNLAGGNLFHANLTSDGFFKSKGEDLIIKPGDWAVIRCQGADYKNAANFTVDHRPKPVVGPDGKIPDYSIDKTSYPNYWVVRFYKPWFVNVRHSSQYQYSGSQYRTYGDGSSDFYVPLEPYQYIEQINSDETVTLLKDLDRR